MAEETSGWIPEGWRVELSRARVKTGMSSEVDQWMRMLKERQQECVATLERDRMAVEMIFRERQDDEEFLYWVSVQGATATANADALEESQLTPIDRDHIAFSRRCKEPGWDEMELQMLLVPEPVLEAIKGWIVR